MMGVEDPDEKSTTTPRWVREKYELRRAMEAAPSHLPEGACDFVPPLELLGIYLVHGAVTRLAYRWELDLSAAAYVNACLGVHAFTIVHHGTHESISRHNSDHAPFENTMFRLAAALIFFDDGYREAHKEHHQKVGEQTDPDLMLAESPLPMLGAVIHATRTQRNYLNIGIGQKNRLEWLYSLGLVDWLVDSWLARRYIVNWHNMVLKMFTFDALEAIREINQPLSNVLRATWRGTADELSTILLALFFARYPHRNGIALEHDQDSYYDNTFRGQNQVDLWMMGEGAHDLHRKLPSCFPRSRPPIILTTRHFSDAKNDVSAAHLAQMRVDVEAANPHLKEVARGTWDLATLETETRLPPTYAEVQTDSPDIASFAIERTQQTLRSKQQFLDGRPVEAMKTLGAAVLDNALHVCLAADRTFLKEVFFQMKLHKKVESKDVPLPVKEWPLTVLSDRAAQILMDKRGMLEHEIQDLARQVGEKISPESVNTERHIQRHYLDMFVAVFDSLVPASEQATFYSAFAKRFNVPSVEAWHAKRAWLALKKTHGVDPAVLKKARERYRTTKQNDVAANKKREIPFPSRRSIIERLRAHLELPLPSNILRTRNKHGAGQEKITRSRVVDIFLAPAPLGAKL